MSNNNFNQIPNLMEMAQKIAQDFPMDDNQNIDMNNMVKHVTESVMNMVGNGEVDINSMTSSLMQGLMQPGMIPQQTTSSSQPVKNSKIKLPGQETTSTHKEFRKPNKDKEKHYEEIEEDEDDDDDEDIFQPRTKDIEINLNVSLEDFYNGTKKKLAVRRKRLKKNSKGEMVQYEEKKKIIIPIVPGMRDEQELRFNKEADEEQGYETGDIVITLYENAHSLFEREGDNLFIIKNISLYEAFAASCGEEIELTIPHLDGTLLKLKTDGRPLHNNDGMRKISGQGMPRFKKDGRGDLFIRFNLTLPKKFNEEDIKILKKLFPPENEKYSDGIKREVREVKLEDVSEEDLEELEYGYSDEESDGSSYDSESSDDY